MANAKTKNKVYLDMSNPITVAVAPLKDDAIKSGQQNAEEIVTRITERLAKAGNDLDVVAPYPKGNMGRAEYMSVLNRIKLYQALTKSRPVDSTVYDRNARHFVDMDAEKIAKFIEDAKEEAAAQYDMFVMKLCAKVGEAISATISGNHVWGFSELTVIKTDGQTEVWRTQQIDNVSCLGKWFPQWPTRKLKEAKAKATKKTKAAA